MLLILQYFRSVEKRRVVIGQKTALLEKTNIKLTIWDTEEAKTMPLRMQGGMEPYHGGNSRTGAPMLPTSDSFSCSDPAKLSDSELDCLKEAFSLFDADHDGEITVHELGRVMRNHGLNPTDDELKDMIRKRGQKLERRHRFQRIHRSGATPTVVHAFRVFDRDGDGFPQKNSNSPWTTWVSLSPTTNSFSCSKPLIWTATAGSTSKRWGGFDGDSGSGRLQAGQSPHPQAVCQFKQKNGKDCEQKKDTVKRKHWMWEKKIKTKSNFHCSLTSSKIWPLSLCKTTILMLTSLWTVCRCFT